MAQAPDNRVVDQAEHPLRRVEARNLERERRFIKKTNESMDTLMVFAGLFSAAIAQFIASTSNDLKVDTNVLTNQLLNASLALLRHPDVILPDFTSPDSFEPPTTSLAINALFFFSLVLSLLAALGAMVVKQWLSKYENHGATESLLHKRTRLHAEKRMRVESWHLKQAIACVPYTLHLALAIFLSGLLLWMFTLGIPVVVPSFTLVGMALAAYIFMGMTQLLPDTDTSSHGRPTIQFKPFWKLTTRKAPDIENGIKGGERLVKSSMQPAEPIGDHAPREMKFILNTPADLQTEGSDLRAHSPDVADAIVWINDIKDTKEHDELLEAFHGLRNTDWGDISLNGPLFKNGDILLSRCSDVARAQWEYGFGGTVYYLNKGARERARKVCLFVEWFYHRLSVEQRRALKGWPNPGIAKALSHDPYSGKEPTYNDTTTQLPPLEDYTLGSSVIAKLHHVQLGPNEVCEMCIVERDPGIEDPRFRLATAEDPRVYTKYDRISDQFPWWTRMQGLISAGVSSDADCILNYTSGLGEEDLRKRIERSSATWFRSIMRYAGKFSLETSYTELREMLASGGGELQPDDPRMEWFEALSRYTTGLLDLGTEDGEETGEEHMND